MNDKIRTYMGCNIYPIARRSSSVTAYTNPTGMRWESYAGSRFVRADTLAGLKSLIRHYSQTER